VTTAGSPAPMHKQGRMPTGVPGLDRVLCGGLVEHGLYLIEGGPGTGKTILSAQIAFHLARQGGRVVFMTLLAESHGKLIEHLRSLSFYDDRLIPGAVTLVSGYRALVEDGLDGLLAFIAETLREQRPGMLILDGLRTVCTFTQSELSFSEFIHGLNTLITTERCTTLLISPLHRAAPQPEHALVDGLIELDHHGEGMQRIRELEVHKMRAADHMLGRHAFTITGDGVRVYPRLEAMLHDVFRPPEQKPARLRFDIESLDAMLRGGLPEGSTTTILGAPGTGKTLLGMKFLEAGVRRGEHALYFGFFESPARLIAKASAVGFGLEPAVRDGRLGLVWQPPLEFQMDELAYRLLNALDETRATRLFIDGLEGFEISSVRRERSAWFLAALSTVVRMRNVTTLFSEALPLFSESIVPNAFRLSATVENVILLRYVEIRSAVRRLISIMKLRDSDYDSSIREFTISPRGIEVASTFESAEQILTGHARLRGHPPPERPGAAPAKDPPGTA